MSNTIPRNINVHLVNEEDAQLKLAQAIGILQKLRLATIKYDDNLGFEARRFKKRWEERADEFLNEINQTNG
jgi:hypothetical protein